MGRDELGHRAQGQVPRAFAASIRCRPIVRRSIARCPGRLFSAKAEAKTRSSTEGQWQRVREKLRPSGPQKFRERDARSVVTKMASRVSDNRSSRIPKLRV